MPIPEFSRMTDEEVSFYCNREMSQIEVRRYGMTNEKWRAMSSEEQDTFWGKVYEARLQELKTGHRGGLNGAVS